MRRSLGWGPSIVFAAVVGAIAGALPYFGLGPDTLPGASSYTERRYGDIGFGLALIWFGAMAVTFVVGVALTVVEFVGRSRRERRQGR